MIHHTHAKNTADEINLCTAKVLEKDVRRGLPLCMAIVRPISEEDVDKLSTTQQASEGTEEKKMYHEEMPEMIKAVLHDYKDIFPSDLPLGLSPVQQGHEFQIDLQHDMLSCPPSYLQAECFGLGKGQEADLVHVG